MKHPVGVEPTNTGFADLHPTDEYWMQRVDLEVIETSSAGCKPTILAIKLQAHMCPGWESNPQNYTGS